MTQTRVLRSGTALQEITWYFQETKTLNLSTTKQLIEKEIENINLLRNQNFKIQYDPLWWKYCMHCLCKHLFTTGLFFYTLGQKMGILFISWSRHGGIRVHFFRQNYTTNGHIKDIILRPFLCCTKKCLKFSHCELETLTVWTKRIQHQNCHGI